MEIGLIFLLATVFSFFAGYAHIIASNLFKTDTLLSFHNSKLASILRSVWLLFLIAFLLRSVVVEPFKVRTDAMYPNLEQGDFILINKFEYGVKLPLTSINIIPNKKPQRGDIALFKCPDDETNNCIRRVIGLPGDTISYLGKNLFINKQSAVKQRDLNNDKYSGNGSGALFTGASLISEILPDTPTHRIIESKNYSYGNIDTQEVMVPENSYFVMGDNRDYSEDSRTWGFIPEDNMKGKAFSIWMNWDNDIDFSRIFKLID